MPKILVSPVSAAVSRERAVPAVRRAVAVLRLLARTPEPLGVNSIARALGLVPSTCLHIVRALVAEQLLKVDPVTKQYGLGIGLLPLARAAVEHSGFSATVQPELRRLSSRYGVTAIGIELVGLEHMIVVALSRARSLVSLQVDIGSRFPALISATGRCVAAFGGHPRTEIEQRFRALRWQNAPSLPQWRREIEQVHRQGYSIDRGDYIGGVVIVAVPMLGMRALTHSIAAVGLADQIDNATAIKLAKDMQVSARALAG
jgi:DNA-binding IclR family transcriptional regulator